MHYFIKHIMISPTSRPAAEYFTALKEYRSKLELAIAGAKRDRFDPTAWNFVKSKHDKIRNLMKDLEEII